MLAGVTYLPRQDRSNGRIARYAVHVSHDGRHWRGPVAAGTWPNDSRRKTVCFDKPHRAGFVKLVSFSQVNDQPFTSIAEFDIIPDRPD